MLKNIFKKNPNLFRKCNELPIHNFNEIAAYDNFDFLKKNQKDKVSIADLQDAWLGILDEFIRISKNIHAANLLKKKAALILLDKRLQVFEAMKICIDKNVDIDKTLKEYRIKKENINAHIGLVKNDISRISKGIPDETTAAKNETDFDRSIALLVKNGFQVNRFTTVVSEWCQMLNILEQQNKPD